MNAKAENVNLNLEFLDFSAGTNFAKASATKPVAPKSTFRKPSAITDPCHEYVERAIAEGRCRKEEFSLKALVIDLKYQARVNPYDAEHIRQLHAILDMQGWLAPIVAFEDMSNPRRPVVRVADGFTRSEVYKRAGRASIPAFIIRGGEQEATEFASMANQQNTVRRRTLDDVRRAVRMLLELDEWKVMSGKAIAAQCGCSHQLAEKIRAEMGISFEDIGNGRVLGRDGKWRKPRMIPDFTKKVSSPPPRRDPEPVSDPLVRIAVPAEQKRAGFVPFNLSLDPAAAAPQIARYFQGKQLVALVESLASLAGVRVIKG